MLKRLIVAGILLGLSATAFSDEDLGNLSANPYDADSTANPYGAGNPYNPDSVNNPYGTYGSEYSQYSVTNPYATETPELYDADGNYRGKLSSNPYDPDSVSNPYGRYGNPYSTESINNPYDAGNPYKADSPTNPYGTGWKIKGQADADSSANDLYSADDVDDTQISDWGTLSTEGLLNLNPLLEQSYNDDSGDDSAVEDVSLDIGGW